MSRKVISWNNIPMRLPIFPTLTLWLVLERLDAPGWVWGGVGTVVAFLWVASVYGVLTQEQTDILK